MNSAAAIRLAVDVLADHFGSVVGRVGTVLLERGALSLADVLRFANAGRSVGDPPLSFPQVRNALLTLVQHGIVDSRPHPQVATSDIARGLLQLYSINIEEILARLRFPHFLEHATTALGDLAFELLFSVLRYGRASASLCTKEARQELDVTAEECKEELQRLVVNRYLRIVEPWGSKGAASSTAPPPLADRPGVTSPLQDALVAGKEGRKRKHGDVTGPAAGGAAQQQPVQPQPGGEGGERELVYRYDRSTLNLCICKNLLCRVVCERVNSYAGQVLAALLSRVRPRVLSSAEAEEPLNEQERGARAVEASFMQFQDIEATLKDLGFHQPGRDPAREAERLRKVLDLLSAHKDGLVRKKVMNAKEEWEVMVPDGPNKGNWARCTITGRGARADTQNVRLAGPEISGEFANVPGQYLRRTQDNQIVEWGVEWMGARRLLYNCATSQLIRDQFGNVGLRIFNLLNEKDPPQKMEEKDIFSTCMVPPAEGREILNEMVRRFIICWQEVPKSANTPLSASYWLYYVDRRRYELTILQNVMQAVLNLRIRFRAESAKVVPLEARYDSLTARERNELKAGRRVEDVLERSFLVLDAAILIFRCF